MGERRGAYRVVVGNPEGKRPLERRRLRWEDNIEMDLPRNTMRGAWTGYIELQIGTSDRLL